MNEYYRIPLKFSDLFKKKELPRCRDVGESISQHIHLILTSQFGEYRYDPTFGCNIWDHDFENIFINEDWNDRVSGSLKQAIDRHEPRLKNASVRAEIMQEEIQPGSKATPMRIKQKVVVHVEGVLSSTNERFETTQKLYLSPLSYD
ncbi:MAG TPA: GPW/gp25 family protein [Chitinophagales bacterium]|nr:GPW/gp25 family protein [Chitinophagales bacterium]